MPFCKESTTCKKDPPPPILGGVKKHPLSLLEIIIVIFLITLITGAVGYSMKGSINKGRAFRTEQAKEQLEDILLLALAEGADIDAIVKDPLPFVKSVGIAKKPAELLKDGWGERFKIVANQHNTGFTISSERLASYKNSTRVPSAAGNAPIATPEESEND